MAQSESKVKLKLLVDKKNEKVLFAEASKDFVDFLFSLMALPLGQVVKLITKNKMVGSLGNLYASIESLGETYIKSSQILQSILNPKASMASFQNPLLLSNTESVKGKKAYMCLNQERGRHCHFCQTTRQTTTYHPHVAENPETICPSCENIMSYELEFIESGCTNQVANPSGDFGFVEGVVTYMVMDNLEVKAMSTISSIALINSFNIKDLSSLQELVVDIGVEEGLKLLKASLQSKDVLSSVFLHTRGLDGEPGPARVS